MFVGTRIPEWSYFPKKQNKFHRLTPLSIKATSFNFLNAKGFTFTTHQPFLQVKSTHCLPELHLSFNRTLFYCRKGTLLFINAFSIIGGILMGTSKIANSLVMIVIARFLLGMFAGTL